jgi:hypothetical protein
MTMDEIQTNHQGRKNLEKLEFEKDLCLKMEALIDC